MYNYFISFVEKSFIRRTYGEMCIGLDFELKDYKSIDKLTTLLRHMHGKRVCILNFIRLDDDEEG